MSAHAEVTILAVGQGKECVATYTFGMPGSCSDFVLADLDGTGQNQVKFEESVHPDVLLIFPKCIVLPTYISDT